MKVCFETSESRRTSGVRPISAADRTKKKPTADEVTEVLRTIFELEDSLGSDTEKVQSIQVSFQPVDEPEGWVAIITATVKVPDNDRVVNAEWRIEKGQLQTEPGFWKARSSGSVQVHGAFRNLREHVVQTFTPFLFR